jgi:hypothetical protein
MSNQEFIKQTKTKETINIEGKEYTIADIKKALKIS